MCIYGFSSTIFDVCMLSMTKTFAHSQDRMQISQAIYKQTAQEKYKIKHMLKISKIPIRLFLEVSYVNIFNIFNIFKCNVHGPHIKNYLSKNYNISHFSYLKNILKYS